MYSVVSEKLAAEYVKLKNRMYQIFWIENWKKKYVSALYGIGVPYDIVFWLLTSILKSLKAIWTSSSLYMSAKLRTLGSPVSHFYVNQSIGLLWCVSHVIFKLYLNFWM